MSYLVLARKYRPQRFEDLVGQEHVARTLVNAIALGRVHHAFLFTGARGVGKTSAARILARALCCEKGPTANPCGACDSCKEIVSGQSIDVQEIDGASNAGVNEVRVLLEGVRYAPAKGKQKVYIIDEVHMLSPAAFNALLKTLEEPPAHVVFIFATTEAHKIPDTIMSRCQRFDFKLISTARLAEHLGGILKTESLKADVDAVRLLAQQASGSVRDGLSLLDQVIGYVADGMITRARVAEILGIADRRVLFELFDAVLNRNAAGALRLLAKAADAGIDLGQLSRVFLGLIHDIELAGLAADAKDLDDLIDISADEAAEAKALAARAPRGLMGALFDRWARGVDEAARSQTPRLILEMALVDLCCAEPLLPLGDLLQRLDDLETRLTGPGGGQGAGVFPPRPARTAAPSLAGPIAAPPLPVLRAVQPPTSDPALAWERVRQAFGARPSLAAALDHAHVAAWESGKVTLVFKERFALEQVEKNRADVEKTLFEVCGAPGRLILQQASAAAGSVVTSQVSREADSAAVDRQHREREAREHPMIRKAQDLFGASPREIKTP